MYDIPVTLTTNPKKKPEDESKLGFGKIFTDHMFIMDYEQGRGWHGRTRGALRPVCDGSGPAPCSTMRRKFLKA